MRSPSRNFQIIYFVTKLHHSRPTGFMHMDKRNKACQRLKTTSVYGSILTQIKDFWLNFTDLFGGSALIIQEVLLFYNINANALQF